MTYKWEAIAQDLTEERDRLLKENERLRRALEYWLPDERPLQDQWDDPSRYHKRQWDIARAALKSEKQ